MLVRKCDRCGKAYEEYSSTESNYNSITPMFRNLKNEIISKSVVKDLCLDCVKAFDDFMNVDNVEKEGK